MTGIQLFQFDDQDIEIVLIDEDFWFNASQVAKALGYTNPSKALQDNVSSKYNQQLDLGRPGKKPNFINEPGLYQLIMRSNLPKAEGFQEWVFEEVLPSIRKTGFYSTQPDRSLAPYWWQRLVLDGNKNKVPAGYFTIFRECMDLVRDLEANGYILRDNLIPDISVGKCWSSYLKSQGVNPKQVGLKYKHHYPDGRVVDAYCYPESVLPQFRAWFRDEYLKNRLTPYLGSRDQQSFPAIERMLELPVGSLTGS